jgi:hypothetical protein
MLAHTDRDERRTWSTIEYFSSAGKHFVNSKIDIAASTAAW